MAKFYEKLTAELINFIQEQQIFFTATAGNEGRINLSPKGMNTFRCIDDKTVAYLDLTGSGNETAAHVSENERMTIMFCSFTEKPLILRLYGKGKVIHFRHKEWDDFASIFTSLPGERQIITLTINSVQTSCGMAVPIYEFTEERQSLVNWVKNQGEEGIKKYWQQKNQYSIDGLPTHLLKD